MTHTSLVTVETTGHPATPKRLWQVAGGLGLLHLVLIFAGLSMEPAAMFEDGRAGIATYLEGSSTRSVVGGYVELLGFLVLIPVLVFLTRALGQSQVGRWAAQCALVAGAAYVTLTFSPGMAAGATSLHAANNGVAVDTAWVMNNLRVITYVLSLMMLGAHAIGIAVAALGDRFSPRLVGVGGIVTGAALLASPLLLPAGLQDIPTLIWSVWWVGLSVQLIRRNGR